MIVSRKNAPSHAPDPLVSTLRASGMTVRAIAQETGSTLREVFRWSAGDAAPRGERLRLLRLLVAKVEQTLHDADHVGVEKPPE